MIGVLPGDLYVASTFLLSEVDRWWCGATWDGIAAMP